ncbi:MAG: GNAT family N-acetyltransferase [Candidatus Sericytochromatia bacterium]
MHRLIDLTSLPPDRVLPLLAEACGPSGDERMDARWQAYRLPGQRLLGWVESDQVIALAGLEIDGAAGRLLHLAVPAGLRQRGLGQKLLRALSRELGLYRLDAETDASALGFYKRCGWTSLALGACHWGIQRFGVYWLDREVLLAPGFRFPAPPLQALCFPDRPDVGARILRLDQIHPLLSGNKWFKLRHNLMAAKQAGCRRLLSLGGAWSNHLFALAAAGSLLGFETTGIVRGELPEPLNPVLSFARDCGMQLIPVTRSEYRQLREDPTSLGKDGTWLIPEGGSNAFGVLGAGEILEYLPADTRTLALACGTAATLAGLARVAPANLKLLGVAVLKGGEFLSQEVIRLADGPIQCRWEIETRFHAGGYARSNQDLQAFLARFAELTPSIPLEPVYTGKLAWALNERFKSSERPESLVLLHSGGQLPEPR